MAKILTDLEVIDIVARAPQEIEEAGQYERFIADLAQVLTTHFGGELGTVEYVGPELFDAKLQKFEAFTPKSSPTVSVAIRLDESVPDGGGVWLGYDPDADREFTGRDNEEEDGGHTDPEGDEKE